MITRCLHWNELMTHSWSVQISQLKNVALILVDFLMVLIRTQIQTALNHCKSNISIGWLHSTNFNNTLLAAD